MWGWQLSPEAVALSGWSAAPCAGDGVAAGAYVVMEVEALYGIVIAGAAATRAMVEKSETAVAENFMVKNVKEGNEK